MYDELYRYIGNGDDENKNIKYITKRNIFNFKIDIGRKEGTFIRKGFQNMGQRILDNCCIASSLMIKRYNRKIGYLVINCTRLEYWWE